MIIFRYKPERYGSKNKIIWRPVADVFFQDCYGNWLELHPYIDSGADVTMIPLSFGKLLGLKKKSQKVEKIGGISGNVSVIYTEIPIRIGGRQINSQIAWALTENVPPSLGRTSIFDQFIVTFKQAQRIIEFQEK